eukprot:584909-Prorocentrum_minimum.AAC.2
MLNTENRTELYVAELDKKSKLAADITDAMDALDDSTARRSPRKSRSKSPDARKVRPVSHCTP